MFAKKEFEAGNMTEDWAKIGSVFIDALFDVNIATASGSINADQMLNKVAYSVIDEGTRIFGDTAIRAMFNDANEFGKFADATDASFWMDNKSFIISETFVQFAGQLATDEVLQSASPDAINGVLSSPNDNQININFASDLWGASSDIIGRTSLLENATISNFEIFRDAMLQHWGDNSDSAIDYAVVATKNSGQSISAADITPAAGEQIFLVGSNGEDTITGSNTNDMLVGRGGNDNLLALGGNDILAGGLGNDNLIGGAGNDLLEGGYGTNLIDGGTGIDTASYRSLYNVLDVNGAGVNVNLATGVASGLNFSDTIVAVENVIGTITKDTITGNSDNNIIDGLGGDDLLDGGAGSDTYNFVVNYGSDTIIGGDNVDVSDVINIDGVELQGNLVGTSAGTYDLDGRTVELISGDINNSATIKIIDGSNSITIENFTDGDYGISLAQAPIGEFRINSTTVGNQFEPSAVALKDGGFVAVWGDSTSNKVMGQKFLDNGIANGEEFSVAGFDASIIHQSINVFGLDDGGFAISWGVWREGTGTYIQKYDVNGDVNGDLIHLNHIGNAGASNQNVALLNDGTFLVTWSENGVDVKGEILNADGSSNGGVFLIDNVNPSIISTAALDTGGFVVAWDERIGSDPDYGALFEMNAQIYNADGSIAKLKFKINEEDIVGPSNDPSLTLLNDGSFLVSWGQREINIEQYSASGEHINSTIIADGGDVNLSPLADGGYVAAWREFGSDGDASGVFGKKYYADGTESAKFQINTHIIGHQTDPEIALLNDGNFIVTWRSFGSGGNDGQDGSLSGVYAEIFDGPTAEISPQYGTDADDNLVGTDGADSIFGGAGNDVIDGGAGDDFVEGEGGDDTVRGGAGNDTVEGDSGYGDDGDDIVIGNGANDTLDGGAGNDTLSGGTGSDLFVFAQEANAADVITDFEIGIDKIDLTDVSLAGLTNFSDLNITQNAADAVVALGNGHVIILQNIDAGALTAADFDGIISDNTAPIAADDSASVNEDGAVTFDILANDADAEDGAIDGSNVTIQSTVTNGALVNNGDGTVTYTPNAGFNGVDNFTYIVTDSQGLFSNLATVNLTINSVNDVPTVEIALINQSVDENSAFNFTIPADAFSDDDGDVLTISAAMDDGSIFPAWLAFNSGTATFSGNPLHADVGEYRFIITATDPTGDSAEQLFTLTINDSFEVVIDGTSRGERLSGTNVADEVFGYQGNDILHGFDGNDSLTGGDGRDKIYGGKGNDTISGGAGKDKIFGDNGNDVITGGADDDNIWGDRGDDNIDGGTGDDLLRGQRGNDTINGGDGDDRAWGGSGNDSMTGGNGQDTLAGGGGEDTLIGSDGNDKLWGGSGNDSLIGGNGKDTMAGGNGSDTLSGGEGDDNLFGQKGTDQISGGNGNDTIKGGSQSDILMGNNGDDKLYGNSENDVLIGGNGNDYLYGGSNRDMLIGGNGEDQLYGGNDRDTLTGGAGADKLYGQGGNDVFVFEALADSTDTNQDTIYYFKSGMDLMDISSLGVTFDELTISKIGTTTLIDHDNSDFSIKIIGKTSIDESDFVF